MKCKHCGANIEADQKICPYCGTANPEAYLREWQLEEIQKKNKELARQVLKDSRPELLYKLHKRVNLALFILLILISVVSFGVYMAKESGKKYGKKSDIPRLYEEGAWDEFALCMRSWDYSKEEEYHDYMHMASLWNCYRSCQIAFAQAYEGYLETGYYKKQYLRECVKYGYMVLTGELSYLYSHENLSEQNKKNLEPFREQVYILFTGILKIPENMLSDLDPEDYTEENTLFEYVLEVLPNED